MQVFITLIVIIFALFCLCGCFFCKGKDYYEHYTTSEIGVGDPSNHKKHKCYYKYTPRGSIIKGQPIAGTVYVQNMKKPIPGVGRLGAGLGWVN